jgi:hypothetical protein
MLNYILSKNYMQLYTLALANQRAMKRGRICEEERIDLVIGGLGLLYA